MHTDNNTQAEQVFDRALDFEASQLAMQKKSERRAWFIAAGAIVLALLLGGALVLLMPLKTVVPYLVTVDRQTGHTQIESVLTQDVISQEDALTRYWLTNYVRWHESYDWYSIQNDYDMTVLFSGPTVQDEYTALFEGDEALDVVWGKQIKAAVSILSIVLDPDKPVATVRFEKTIKNTADKGPGKPDIWLATMTYEYNNPTNLSDADRLKNPLGFSVTSYRLDPELVQK